MGVLSNIYVNFMKYLALQVALWLVGSLTFAQIPIRYLDAPPQIDADLSDWTIPLLELKQASPEVKSINELHYAFGFDETYLYGIFKVKDQHLTDLAKDKSGSPRISFNDGVEFYIDTQNNSNAFMDDDDFQLVMDCIGNLTVFRGGDKFLIKVEKHRVPKDTMTARFVMDYKTVYQGTINNDRDTDDGYVIEFQVAWAALGLRPKANELFKIDVCLNDADEFLDIRPLAEDASIPHYVFYDINGNTDFGFPSKWSKAVLTGEPSVWKSVRWKLGGWKWPLMGLILGVLIWIGIRWINRPSVVFKTPETIYREEVVKPTNSLQSKATQLILENLSKEILANDLAEHFNVSLRQLQRQFREEIGMTPTDLIRKIKLEEAAKMLLNTPKNIAEIAYEVGFSDPAYFSRTFKKHFGKTPTEFQENAQKA